MEYRRFTLDNGALLGVVLVPHSSSITASAYLPAGYKYDPKGKPGLAHFTEHLMLAGTKKYPNSHKLAVVTARHGGWQSAFTWIDYQEHMVKLPRKNLSDAIDVLLQTLIYPLIKKTELEKEREIIKEEISRNTVDPERAVWEYAWNETFWYGTELARSYTGLPEEIDTISVLDVKDFIETRIALDKTSFLIAGNLDPEKIYKLFNMRVGKVTREGKGVKSVQPSPGGRVTVLKRQEETSQFMLGFKTVSASHTDSNTLEIITRLLGGSFAGRIINRLREEGGFIYNWEMSQDLLQETGYIFFKSSTANSQLKKVLRIICEEFGSLKKDLVSEKDFELARQQLIGSLFVDLETTDTYCRWFGLQEVLAGYAYTPEEKAEIYAQISREDVLRVASKYFTPDGWYLAVVGQGDETALKTLVKSSLSSG